MDNQNGKKTQAKESVLGLLSFLLLTAIVCGLILVSRSLDHMNFLMSDAPFSNCVISGDVSVYQRKSTIIVQFGSYFEWVLSKKIFMHLLPATIIVYVFGAIALIVDNWIKEFIPITLLGVIVLVLSASFLFYLP